MFMLLVEFEIKPEFSEQFHIAVLNQAKTSLREEPLCHFFEVTRLDDNPNKFVLSEVYTSSAAFDYHLTTDHFINFDNTVKEWLVSKEVRSIE